VKTKWTEATIPDLTGKTVIVTGASSGLGLEASAKLSAKGATVIMAVRNLEKGRKALLKIRSTIPSALAELIQLDLSDLESISRFADVFVSRYSQLDILINNAGILWPKRREETRQGFELQFGVNHLGHFALTGLLLNVIKNTQGSRVITQSSLAHRFNADIQFDDLNWNRHYNKMQAYAQSKLANVLFTYELDRRFKTHGIKAIAVASHPGFANTALFKHAGPFVSFFGELLGQKPGKAVLPVLRAATDQELHGAEYIGPTGIFELAGYPGIVRSAKRSYDETLARKLWEVSEQLTGIRFNFS